MSPAHCAEADCFKTKPEQCCRSEPARAMRVTVTLETVPPPPPPWCLRVTLRRTHRRHAEIHHTNNPAHSLQHSHTPHSQAATRLDSTHKLLRVLLRPHQNQFNNHMAHMAQQQVQVSAGRPHQGLVQKTAPCSNRPASEVEPHGLKPSKLCLLQCSNIALQHLGTPGFKPCHIVGRWQRPWRSWPSVAGI